MWLMVEHQKKWERKRPIEGISRMNLGSGGLVGWISSTKHRTEKILSSVPSTPAPGDLILSNSEGTCTHGAAFTQTDTQTHRQK